VHGFLRGSYGSPQSLGCVELPYAAAGTAYQLMNYGTLVTVAA
jgi:lipoprotein-anchoring transpeptidase ErfK/SrfK